MRIPHPHEFTKSLPDLLDNVESSSFLFDLADQFMSRRGHQNSFVILSFLARISVGPTNGQNKRMVKFEVNGQFLNFTMNLGDRNIRAPTIFFQFLNAGRQGATRESISHGVLLTEY